MEQLFLDIVQNGKPLAWLYQFLMMVLVSMVLFVPIPVLATFNARYFYYKPNQVPYYIISTSFIFFKIKKEMYQL